MPTPKKANLLDKLYRAYKKANPNTSNVTDRINTIYREGGYKGRVDRDWFEKIDGGEKPSAGWKTELNVTPMQSDPYRLNELSNNDLFYLYERTGRPEYGLEISRRHNKMVEENKKNFPYLFGEQTEK